MVRQLLDEAANAILTRTKTTFALKSWALKIAKRRGLRKARVALARRLAVIAPPAGLEGRRSGTPCCETGLCSKREVT
jgi:transposase